MKIDSTSYGDFGEVVEHLDEIVKQVRGKDTSLEHALDLFDEAIALGGRAVDLVDKIDFTPEERARLNGEKSSASADVASEDVPLATSEQDSVVADTTEDAASQADGDTAEDADAASQADGDTAESADAALQADGDTAESADAALQTDDHA